MGDYYELLLGEELPRDRQPVEAKRELARRLTDRFAGDGAGAAAEARFDQVHVRGELPDEIEVASVTVADGEPVHLPGADRRRVRDLLQRGQAPDPAGRRQARRRAGRPADAGPAGGEPRRRRASGRQAPVSPSRGLTGPRAVPRRACYIPASVAGRGLVRNLLARLYSLVAPETAPRRGEIPLASGSGL